MSAQDPILTATAQSPSFPPKETTTGDDQKVLLAKANEAMYKQNVELAVKNKTLSVLRELSDITMKTTSVSEVSQAIVDIVVKELSLAAAIIALVDTQNNALRPVAITRSESMVTALSTLGKNLEDIAIPLDYLENLSVNAIRDREQKITGNLLDLLVPITDQQTSDEIERISGIKTIIIYPLFLGDKAIGVLDLGLTKSADDLSRAERETLHELIGVVTIAINRAQLSENIKKANEDLQSVNKQLETLDKLKDEFVSVASHELRTPMTAIKSYTWMLLNNKAGQLEPKAREYANRVFLSTERLIHLVNDMLDVSRIESGRTKIQITSVDLSKLASDVQGEFQARATENNLHLEVQAEGDIPTIQVDGEKIHQVLENLVGNAFKFTPTGGTITIAVKQADDSIEVHVADTGRGIGKDDFPKLFQKFARLENSLVAMPGNGTGLGLYICKQYIELHKGKIWIESELGKGTTVYFTLPLSNPLQPTDGTVH